MSEKVRELLKRNLFHNIELIVTKNSKFNGELIFGGVNKTEGFKILSSQYLEGRIYPKSFNEIGFYVQYEGFPIKVNLKRDNIYEQGGRLVISKI